MRDSEMDQLLLTRRLMEDHHPPLKTPLKRKDPGLFKTMYSQSMYMLSRMNNLSLLAMESPMTMHPVPMHHHSHLEHGDGRPSWS
jgi:hypothetical protein